MNRETTQERLLALKEQLHELAGAVNEVAIRVEILDREHNERKGERPKWRGIRDE